jgi:hypothetical protein
MKKEKFLLPFNMVATGQLPTLFPQRAGRQLDPAPPQEVGVSASCSCSSLLLCPLGRPTAACPGLLAVCCSHTRVKNAARND